MALATYNGFDHDARMAAHHWQQKAVRDGLIPAPTTCIACGQLDGAFDMHLEDYDQPARYWALCLACHLMLHSRYHLRPRFLHYRGQVTRGWQAPPIPRDGGFNAFNRMFSAGQWPSGSWGAPRGRTFLDELTLERGRPAVLLVPA